jgi:hypothetical protein
MEEIKYFKVEAPKGYEIDKENSTWDNIRFKKIEQEVRTWDDLIGTRRPKTQVWVGNSDSNINSDEEEEDIFIGESNRFEFIDAKHAKSALAMAQISQLIPHFGGIITDEEWKDIYTIKYIICRTASGINSGCYTFNYDFLAFHTEEQRDNFLKYNERLVKDYLMLD